MDTIWKKDVIAGLVPWFGKCVLGGAFVGLGFLPAPAAAQPLEQMKEQMKWCLNKGNAYSPDLVIKGCTAVIESFKAPVWYFARGNAYAAKKDYDHAMADYTQALQLDPKDPFAHNNRGTIYNKTGDYDRAIADLNQAIQFDPKYAAAFFNRGDAYSAKKDYDRAIADYTQALQLDPKDAAAYVGRGYSYNAKKNYDAAIADYTQAIHLSGKEANPSVYAKRGLTYCLKKDYANAIADFNFFLRVQPNDALVLYGRGVAKLGVRDRSGDSDIEAAKSINPNVAELSARLGLPVYGTYVPMGNIPP